MDLPPVISTYLQTAEARDVDGCAACFTEDALVHDEGRDHRGIDAIRAWIGELSAQFELTFTVLRIEGSDGMTVARVEVAGNFPGSPATLHQHYSLAGGRIRALTICP